MACEIKVTGTREELEALLACLRPQLLVRDSDIDWARSSRGERPLMLILRNVAVVSEEEAAANRRYNELADWSPQGADR